MGAVATRLHEPQPRPFTQVLPRLAGAQRWALGDLSGRIPRLAALATVLALVGMTGTITGLLAPSSASSANRAPALQGVAAAGTPGPAVVLIGDSHAWLWALHNTSLVDLGVPGLTTGQILPQVTEALALHPHTVVVSAGTNDLVQGLGWAAAAANITAMVNQIKAAGTRPILLLVPDFSPGMKTAGWAQLGLGTGSPAVVAMPHADQIPALNKAIRGLGVPLLQAPAGETIDGVHLDAAAYTSLTGQLAALTR